MVPCEIRHDKKKENSEGRKDETNLNTDMVSEDLISLLTGKEKAGFYHPTSLSQNL